MNLFKLVLIYVLFLGFCLAKVDLNSASKDELMSLNGVGSAKAEAIIEYRKHSKFNTINDLKRVKGFGPKVFDKLKDDIEVISDKMQETEQKNKEIRNKSITHEDKKGDKMEEE